MTHAQTAVAQPRASGSANEPANVEATELSEQNRQAADAVRAGDLTRAEILYRQILEQDSQNRPAAVARGAILAKLRPDDEEAIAALERARDLAPEHAQTRANLGLLYARKGWAEKADESYREAYRLGPDIPENAKIYGGWCRKQGRRGEAIEALERGLAIAPDDASRQGLLGILYHEEGRDQEAKACFGKAVALAPDSAEFNAHYGSLLWILERAEEALPYFVKGFPHKGLDSYYQTMIAEALVTHPLTEDIPALSNVLSVCFDSRVIDLETLTIGAGRYLAIKYARESRVVEGAAMVGAGASEKKLHMDGFLADPVLLRLLTSAINTNSILEALLLPVRRSLLFKAPGEAALSPGMMRFIAALAIQCHNNCFAFFAEDDEQSQVLELRGRLEQWLLSEREIDPVFERDLALYATYEPILALKGVERLVERPSDVWQEALRPLIEQALLAPAEERRLKDLIPSFGSIDDAVSKTARSQYEASPYPRWVALPQLKATSFDDYLAQLDPEGRERLPETGRIERCLIAGCGTGRHPIAVALRLPGVEVTATDFSLSALAYGQRMAAQYDVPNLTFHHGDLLDSAALGMRFDAVECSGVLHHLGDPEQGLRALLSVLRPGGFIRVGVYSARAREWASRARQRIAALGLDHSEESIRAFRHRVLENREENALRYLRLRDFYALDSFRDVVFEFVEHQFTVPEIAGICARNDLEFLGFASLRPAQRKSYRDRFPKDPGMLDFANWEAFERDNPDTFANMYDFWCRKPL